jgi:hypothetical protein
VSTQPITELARDFAGSCVPGAYATFQLDGIAVADVYRYGCDPMQFTISWLPDGAEVYDVRGVYSATSAAMVLVELGLSALERKSIASLQRLYDRATAHADDAYAQARPNFPAWSTDEGVIGRYVKTMEYKNGVDDAIYAAGYKIVNGTVEVAR